jgi:hypothetical protein
VLHIQDNLVESIQADRRSEARAARLSASLNTPSAARCWFAVLPAFVNRATRTRTTVSHTAIAADKPA